ncbi:MAG: 16S rRNA (guanine(527)-N(7))-methyltransferase RsmG [Clostridiales bacterium]|nr:16S rRNA (guanine(527)-N(7))-methyltransferase RsmG [Clostridiales bacterium]
MKKETFIHLLFTQSQQAGLSLTQHQCALFYQYHRLLLEYNQFMDLTTITNDEEMIHRHYLDSLTLLSFEKAFSKQPLSIIDVGTGAGLPGIPLAILLPQAHITLLDAQKKRISFLQEVTSQLGLSHVTLLHGRAEETAHSNDHREKYALATARAVAPLPVLLEYLLPFVSIGGHALALKGPNVCEEFSKSSFAAETLGGNLYPPVPLHLPMVNYEPFLSVCEKISSTPTKYPRKPGIPSKRPL